MDFKPGDFFLSIVTFFGVLLPGAILLFLRGPFAASNPVPLPGVVPEWAAFLVAAYVAGHILLAATELLNPVAAFLADKLFRTLAVNGDFREALSYIRLQSAAAAGEVDRHMADYKLLRNLVAVFLIDLVCSLTDSPLNNRRALWDSALALLSFGGFVRLHYWARRLAFQYRSLLDEQRDIPEARRQL